MSISGDNENSGSTPEPRIRVLLADDHTMLREGLRRAMEAAGFEVVGEASDGDEVIHLAEELHPNVILMDVSMPIRDGVEATKLVRERVTDVNVVMLTMHADSDVVQRAIRAGAIGYLVKDSSTEEVVRAVKMAANGETVLSPELAAAMLHESAKPSPDPIISKREEEVLQLIAEGCSTVEVAERLYISVKTVKNHLASAYQKLDARDRTQAILRAHRMGIIKLD
jgi:DNA-binding NarL/FixJ family response regulator